MTDLHAGKPADRDETSVLREAMRLYIMEQRRLLHEQGSPAQWRLLVLLLRPGAMTQAEFGRVMGLEKSWVSRAVDKLVQLGWLVRTPLPEDRRSMQLALTPAGRKIALQVDARMNAHASSVLDRLPAKTRAQVVSALQELCNALQQPLKD